MRCFGLIAVANMKCGRLMDQANFVNRRITAQLWQDEEIRSKLDLNGDGDTKACEPVEDNR